MTKQSVLVRRNMSQIWTRKNLTTFGLQLVTTLFERGNECEYIHSKGNCPLFQMPYLAKSYDASVVSYLTWKLGVTFFLNHPVYQRKRRRETLTAKNQEISSLKQLRSLIHHKILPEPRWSFRQAQRSCVFPFRCGNSRTVADFKLTPLISPSPMTEPNTNAHDLPLNDGLKAWYLLLKENYCTIIEICHAQKCNQI